MKLDVSKTILIDASLEKVGALVADFNHWNSWSPWVVIEPTCSVEISGSPDSSGHAMAWGGEVIGSGNNTLVSSESHRLDYALEFYKPWKSKAKVSFIYEEIGSQTQVSWVMDSSMPFFLFFMVKTMKNWIGIDYERGLRMLKEVAEQGEVKATTSNNGIVDYQGFSYMGIQRTVAIPDMPAAMERDFQQLVNDIVIEGKQSARHWVCLYPKFDIKEMEATYIAAVSDENLSNLALGSDYVKGQITTGRVLEIKHTGSYEFLGNAWSMGMMNVQAKKLKCGS